MRTDYILITQITVAGSPAPWASGVDVEGW